MTDRQLEYLLLFATQSSKGRCISNAAAEFNVTMASASHVGTTLEREGLIRKCRGGVLELTDRGRELIAPKVVQMKCLEEWLEIEYGLPPSQAEQEARRMVVALQADTVEKILHRWLAQKKNWVPPAGPEAFFRTLSPGLYHVPVHLCKKGGNELSMGDRGFQKPAVLIREEDACYFLLYPIRLEYRPLGFAKLHTGTLERLWYLRDDSWYEAEMHVDGGRMIASAAVSCSDSSNGFQGTVRVRVRSTLNIVKMPESEADMVFELSALCKKRQS